MKRIRFKPTKVENELESIKLFTNERGRLYRAKINIQDFTYRIVEQKEKRVVRSSQKDNCKKPSTREILLRQVKRALKSLGVNFEHEFRKLKC